ncbi:hypothetical protein PUNSTDRAFT_144457 [Punctularia strigosozonata HHB-11173 SS5]|uniref:uncharacterized protein n=1 Tax=Punctularia strigosozonata (strain HHB-11173) TaxID=741275 RepID=UPI0004417BD3|nr:uncharacterized protein PUNSTDRAFT_144457 [Punctularia strigosozonata HHB-11173 SS5]EIN07990.1 hypothetical protein PUNSTDRAFT_144457 [Punctularia strigosozonata HHB-11173 SS5]
MDGIDSLTVSDQLLPRRYQEEIFVRAQEGNIIAALDTGSGKTFISTLLMKWIASKPAESSKIIIFLVPKVPLVEQQATFIERQTPLRVGQCYGANAWDLTDRGAWRRQFAASDVIVMTAQIFLNLITHSHWSMDRVSLLVFDECHHTRKNHAYNGIMREYFQCPGHLRPKIFGMTASPIWNPKDAATSLATLEKNMDAKVFAVREHESELLSIIPKPKEVLVDYPPPPDSYPTYPSPLLANSIDLTILPPAMELPLDKIETRYHSAHQILGPFGAEYYLWAEVKQRIAAYMLLQMEARRDEILEDMTNAMALDSPPIETHHSSPSAVLSSTNAVLDKFAPLLGDADSVDPDVVQIDIDIEWCTPQVAALAETLISHYKPTFQGIVFVEQRHIAVALARLLGRLPELRGRVRCADLVGHGGQTTANLKGMEIQGQQDVVRAFRRGEINLLVATSVAEEGLDFPACDLVIRFDPLQHMVGYLQSRGRARHHTSTFVIMVPRGSEQHIMRYRTFADSEPQMKQIYQTQNALEQLSAESDTEEGECEEPEHPEDLAERERYVIPSTLAVLTYHSAIGMLSHLCSLIPRDRYTPIHQPKYTGEFQVTLQLPSSLPLPPEDLTFVGPLKRSKREAKCAAAFMAVRKLHQLGVFDDYLLPVRRSNDTDAEDPDGIPIPDISAYPDMLRVAVHDPWVLGPRLWMHVLRVDGRATSALVTGTSLPPVSFTHAGAHVQMSRGKVVAFDMPMQQRELMEAFTWVGIRWCVTLRGPKQPLSQYLVALTNDLRPDWDTMERVVNHPWGHGDWTGISEAEWSGILCMNQREHGRALILQRMRHDITPLSTPPPGSRESTHPTYREYFLHKWSRKGITLVIPDDTPLAEVCMVTRRTNSSYPLHPAGTEFSPEPLFAASKSMVVPFAFLRRLHMSAYLWRTFHLLPRLLHRVTDLYRVQRAKQELGLPPIPDDLLVEAYTLPHTGAGFSNQRLETLGDSVLKLCVIVHLLNRFRRRHEGQLDALRRNAVANRTLLARAHAIGLGSYLTCETMSVRTWRHVVPEEQHTPFDTTSARFVARSIPRRCLQDCMEATLGAAFLGGGIPMALQAGTVLGMSLGGPVPWNLRYGRKPIGKTPAALFHRVQEALHYDFHNGDLLIEASTHPSFESGTFGSYQRLEFLGDALIDLVVMQYLYRKFPEGTPGQLSWARSRAVCSQTMAWVAVTQLELNKIMLVNNSELNIALAKYIPILEDFSAEDIIAKSWKLDPPKALSDVLESIMGAVLLDTAYDYERSEAVVEWVMRDVLDALTLDLPPDPISQLMISTAKAGCRRINFKKTQSNPKVDRNDGISVIVHDIPICGPIPGSSLSLCKALAAEQALGILFGEAHEHNLATLCDCKHAMVAGLRPDDEDEKTDDETPSGFAAVAREKLLSLEKTRPNAGEMEEGEVVE